MRPLSTKSKKKNMIVRIVTIIIVAMMVLGSIAFLAHGQTVTSTAPTATTAQTLQDQINEKTKQLDAVNKQITSAKTTLQATQSQRVTLQQQLNSINGSITTLTLGIQSDELTNQQLALQIEQLGTDIQSINDSVATKGKAIGSLLQEIAAQDTTNQMPLAILLRNGTLADSVLEAQNVHNLQGELAQNINDLKSLHDAYDNKIQISTAKKQDIASHEVDLQSKKQIVQDQQAEKKTLLATTKDQESLFQKQLAALQKQQQQVASDIEALDAILRTKINPSTIPAATAGVLLVPVAGDDQSDITQGYGATAFAKNGYAGHWHNGVDLAASVGTPLLAAADGTVAATGNNDTYCPKGAYGKFVAINFINNLTGLYGHMSQQIVRAGDHVTRGQLIGYSGKTGYALGPHLHFTIFATPTFYMSPSKYCGPLPVGGDINPIPFLF
jgi:murein DD-endopeptidase MepM/ murein hydrolase activator NlpD